MPQPSPYADKSSGDKTTFARCSSPPHPCIANPPPYSAWPSFSLILRVSCVCICTELGHSFFFFCCNLYILNIFHRLYDGTFREEIFLFPSHSKSNKPGMLRHLRQRKINLDPVQRENTGARAQHSGKHARSPCKGPEPTPAPQKGELKAEMAW